ncbi:MAG TPA: wax ester/triacylglycerol synthase domain-containing protein, partial [Conexibacter sp.]
MAAMDGIPLGPEDRAILALESETVAGHTCKIVRVGAGAPDLGALRARVAERIARVPLLSCRLGGLPGAPCWVPDPDFAVERHVGALKPPQPCDRRAMLTAVGALFEQRLPRDRPLWRIDTVPLDDGAVALVWRIHHSLADGTTALRYARELLWDDADAPSADAARRTVASTRPGAEAAARDAAPAPPPSEDAARGAEAHARDDARRRRHLAAFLEREYARSRAPSPFDGAIGRRREVGLATASLPQLHDAAQAQCGATVNDAVLAVVAGALRRWIERHHGTLDGVRVRVPVSLHHDGDATANSDSFFALQLPLDEPDPCTRLSAIHAATTTRKADHDAESRAELLRELGRASPRLRDFATRLERNPRRFALSVSNVRGPRAAVRLLGAPVERLHS